MMAIALSQSATKEYSHDLKKGKVVVACINSPNIVTISGDVAAIEEIEAIFKEKDIWARKLKLNTAYHSHHMSMIAVEYLSYIIDVSPKTSEVAFTTIFSSVTKEEMAPSQLGASYWVQNMLQPVEFSGAVATLLAPKDAKSKRQK